MAGMPAFCVKVHLACLQCQTVITPKYLNALWLPVSLTETIYVRKPSCVM